VTRIIAGRAGGRRLETPDGDRTRPTSDRVREALFSAIESRVGSLHGLRVLDLYAGSGAIGLEAWSRGAEAVTLVESDRRTADLIRRNAGAVGCEIADIRAVTVASALATAPAASYDIVFSDPPYPLTDDELAHDLELLADHGWLAPDALLVVERGSRSPEPAWPAGIEPRTGKRRMRKYGETTLWYATAAASSS